MSTTSASRTPELVRLAAAFLLALAVSFVQAAGRGAALPDESGPWVQVGGGTMRWLGFELYEASLWTHGGAPWHPDRPYALRIEYRRAISSERLVSVSLDEMARLGFDAPQQLARWKTELERAFPSVAAGDVIVGVARPGQGAAFFHRGALTAEVRDETFARAFFAIWLDARTREPALRTQLLGGRDEG